VDAIGRNGQQGSVIFGVLPAFNLETGFPISQVVPSEKDAVNRTREGLKVPDESLQRQGREANGREKDAGPGESDAGTCPNSTGFTHGTGFHSRVE